jgi:predicted aspartyl protease
MPPFPTVPVTLRNDTAERRIGPLPALLDTGSDGTLVPIDHLWQIRATPISDARIRSHWGELRRVQLFLVELAIDELTLPGVIVVGDDEGDEIVLGRNVLNKLRVLLNGPAGSTDLRSK